MVRVKCKGCGGVLVDTDRGIENYVEDWDLDIKATLKGQKLDLKRVGVCTNCGHKFDIKKLEDVLGRIQREYVKYVELNKNVENDK